MNPISKKISALLLIMIFSLTFGQEVKDDSVNYETIKNTKDTIQCENVNYKFRNNNDKNGFLCGTVTDEYGNPIKEAIITISGTTYGAETDEDGKYWIIGIKEGTYSIKSYFTKHQFQVVKDVKIRTAYILYQDFILPKIKDTSLEGSLKGSVLDENNNPLPGANIVVIGTSWGAEADENGNYLISGVRTGKYTIRAEFIGYSPREVKDIEIRQDSIVTVNLKIKLMKINLEKPIIYIYPEKETKVNVKLDYKGTFTATYPKYPEGGWTVTAKPDGTLTDKAGRMYYSLFWEGVDEKGFTLNEGFIVKKEDAAEFLEKSLKTLGLNYKEANEFIIFWLPELEKNPYNLIHFSTKEYEELAKLTITPEPETIIRVFMVFKGLDKPVEIKEQKLVPKHRKGYTVVEWGGSEVREGKSGIR